MMTLKHSKTWPVSTLAVVQLRVDPHGRAYSLLTENEIPPVDVECTPTKIEPHVDDGPRVVLPLSRKYLEMFAKMSGEKGRALRTDTVSTILEQDSEMDYYEHGSSKCDHQSSTLERFHVLALARIDENVNETESGSGGGSGVETATIGRRASLKVDNWDFVFTETYAKTPVTVAANNGPARCPIHCCGNGDADGVAANRDTKYLLPDVPLDARKTTTLRRHYYPEGGWGWVIVVCTVLVHVLNHGVQLGCSQLVVPGAHKFKVDTVHFAGKSPKLS